ncbi:tetratricopeptide repeat protein [Actinokineospora fastidiosa]|uniref:tetratricopeptide repeat protein n=1 Tax=Actinokineospora fastidiosa TaxID=1816 RepID=UPI00166FE702|nr:tetratricopeptide repeat protein [Actinokineospora fastidiosa]
MTPAQLMRSPTAFVGRERELAELSASVPGGGLVVLTGIGGVGKTTLAVHWLRGLDEAGFDGSLVADLRGPASAAEVTEWFLLSLGVPAERIPLSAERRAALYRSMTAGRRLRVMLDDAVSAAQVRPLIPAGPGSVVVVTSRSWLSGLALDGARWLRVEPMDDADAVRLLEVVAGPSRVGADTGAAARLARLCGGLPLALSVVGARLLIRGRRPLSSEVRALTAEHERLARLTLEGDVSVSAALDVSYLDLDDRARAAYRACAWHPGREFGSAVLAAALGWPAPETEDAVATLFESGLVDEVADGRYALHDLVRLHGRAMGGEEVVRSMVEWYLDRTVAADLAVHPLRPRIGPAFAAPAAVFAGPEAGLAWAAVERANVRAAVEVAAERGWDELVWQFCEALWGQFLHTRRYGEWIELQRMGIGSARRCGNMRAEGRLRAQLGYAYAQLGQADDAAAQSRRALELARRGEDVPGEATAWEQLALALRRTDPEQALECLARSRELNERLGRDRGVALCRRRSGEVLADLGRFDEAADHLLAAAATMAELADPTQHARAIALVAEVRSRQGRADQARSVLVDALARMRAFGSPYYQAEILAMLGGVAERTGDATAAREAWSQAAALYEGVDDDKAGLMRSRLARDTGEDAPHRT